MKRGNDSQGYAFSAKVWIYSGAGGWHFVTLPKKLAAEIQFFHSGLQKNFGSIAVTASIGHTSWKTSLFRDSKSASYLLPLKADVRKKEKIMANQKLHVRLTIG